MLTPEEHALLTDIQDRLIELYVLREYANKTGDAERIYSIQAEILKAETQRKEVRQFDTVGSA